MSERLTFENFSPVGHGLDNIYQIGVNDEHPSGVGQEMAAAFNYDLTPRPDVDNLGGLISEVGRNKELQKNIAVAQSVLALKQLQPPATGLNAQVCCSQSNAYLLQQSKRMAISI